MGSDLSENVSFKGQTPGLDPTQPPSSVPTDKSLRCSEITFSWLKNGCFEDHVNASSLTQHGKQAGPRLGRRSPVGEVGSSLQGRMAQKSLCTLSPSIANPRGRDADGESRVLITVGAMGSERRSLHPWRAFNEAFSVQKKNK